MDSITLSHVDYTYEDLAAASLIYNEHHDCAVISTSVVTNEAYPKVHELFRQAGRRHRCFTPVVYIFQVIEKLGYKLQDITKFYEGSSLRTIVPQLPTTGSYLIFTQRHSAGVRNGIIHDGAKYRKMYVKRLFQVDTIDAIPVMAPPKRARTVVIDYTQPTKAVHAIADIMFEDEVATMPSVPNRRWWSTFRAKVIAECTANSVNKTTAAVQMTKWMAERNILFKWMSNDPK